MEEKGQVTNKKDFIQFLTDEKKEIHYDGKKFVKQIKGNLIKIRVEEQLVYEVHKEKKLLIVVNALYCGYNRDEYWGIAKEAGLEEVLADGNTLIRV